MAAKPTEGRVAPRPVLAASGRTIRGARQLRRAMTLPERMLWVRLRGRKGEERWRKQHPCGAHYVLDFFNPGARLCVEVDGIAHDMGNRPAHDARRDRWLTTQGIAVLRVAATDVLRDADAAADGVVRHAAALRAVRPSVALRAPPPRSGEEWG